ncbi:MAG: hypothetical protein IAE80_03320 [Anaerolinea sp.]|nr:hypothetical protein [Anaerolinea sp.]
MIRVVLHDPAVSSPLTPDLLSQRVVPYLSALTVAQTVADILQERDSRVIIEQLHGESGHIVALISGANDAILFSAAQIPAWREEHSAAIRLMRELDDMLTWVTSTTQEDIFMRQEDLRRQIQPDLLRLVFKFLNTVSPVVPELGQVVYIDRLLAAFHSLTFSPLTLRRT